MSIQALLHSVLGTIPAILQGIAFTFMLDFQKRKKWLFLASYLTLGLIIDIVLDNILGLHALNGGLQIALFTVTAIAFSEGKLLFKLAAVAVIYICVMLSEGLGTTVYLAAGGYLPSDAQMDMFKYPGQYVMAMVMCDVFIVLLLHVAVLAWNRVMHKSSESVLLLFVLFPLSQCLQLWWGTITFTELNGSERHLLIFDAFGIVGLIADVVMLLAVRQLMEAASLRQRTSVMESQLARQEDYYQHITSDISAAAKMRHDIRNQLQAAYALMDAGKLAEARGQLGQLGQRLDEIEPCCENHVVAAVVREKSEECQRYGISLKCSLSIGDDCGIDGLDLCSVFANILDNAVAACRESGSEAPAIELTASEQSGFMIIKCVNTAREQKTERKTRSSLSEHGWGLVILEDIANRYEGKLSATRGDGTFQTTVWLKA